eukprot:756797-Hanusia_phi.AAC.1
MDVFRNTFQLYLNIKTIRSQKDLKKKVLATCRTAFSSKCHGRHIQQHFDDAEKVCDDSLYLPGSRTHDLFHTCSQRMLFDAIDKALQLLVVYDIGMRSGA